MQYNWPLIGHDRIKRYFEKALASGKFHHAYLFEGPEHLGKAAFARLLAKSLLCEGSAKEIPCRTCRACEAYGHGAHPDFLELRRGEEESISIEQAREFIAGLITRPLLGPIKVGMIEEAGRMTAEAASSLLKTLEEPASHAVLFLVSAEPLLPTISSRCQRIAFQFVPMEVLEKSIGAAAQAPEAMEIARLASGRPGVAVELRNTEAFKAYQARADEMLDLLMKDEGDKALWITQEFGALKGAQRRTLLSQWLEVAARLLHDCLMVAHGMEERVEHLFLKDTIAASRDRLPLPRVLSMLRRVEGARNFLAANVDPRLICEYIFLDA